jgi:hypothetical protein
MMRSRPFKKLEKKQAKNFQNYLRKHITIGTVRVHVHAILQKLEVRDRTSAAIMAIQQNLIIIDSN